MLAVQCPSCGFTFEADNLFAGGKALCPSCTCRVSIPAEAGGTAAPPPVRRREEYEPVWKTAPVPVTHPLFNSLHNVLTMLAVFAIVVMLLGVFQAIWVMSR